MGEIDISGQGNSMCDGPKLEQHAEELSGCWCCWSVEGEKESDPR